MHPLAVIAFALGAPMFLAALAYALITSWPLVLAAGILLFLVR
jgi:hypothetical protein